MVLTTSFVGHVLVMYCCIVKIAESEISTCVAHVHCVVPVCMCVVVRV